MGAFVDVSPGVRGGLVADLVYWLPVVGVKQRRVPADKISAWCPAAGEIGVVASDEQKIRDILRQNKKRHK